MIGKLLNRQRVATNTVEMTFGLSREISFTPGQYATIRIVKPRLEDYQMNERIFSIVNSPTQKRKIKILFRDRNSGFKKNLKKMALGEEVEIDQPIGMFNLPEDKTIPLVFLASGVGVAPFMSVLENMKQTGDDDRKVIMFFSNRTVVGAPYLKELKELSEALKNFHLIETFTREVVLNSGTERTSLEVIKKNVSDFARANFFLAGQPEFVEDLVRQLLEDGVPKEKVTQESFDGY